ncbi:hypothetical protein PUMCH_004828 [Australozyma saopauloensis]|uniref:RNI-like protein n=1 Tax=Australozyma saopauloensis TaxID=291208 RepID=A0AAX4HGF5_9ASCO|nr:hypothetical protein PUMCH_004828 [[Candida] saopauloensis]
MSDTPTLKQLDWNKVHELVIDQANEVVGNVDWFLRDSNVSLSDQSTQTPSSPPVKHHLADHNAQHAALVTPSSPHLQVLNTHENSVSKTRPLVAAIQPVLTISGSAIPARDPKRRGSASSVASTGSATSNGTSASGGRFFSKLKHRLQRTDSAASSASSPGSLFHGEYNLETSLKNQPSINTSLDSNFLSDSFDPKSPHSPAPPIENSPVEDEDAYDDPQLLEYVRLFKYKDVKPDTKATHLNSVPRTRQNSLVCPHPKSPKTPEPGKFTSLFRRRSSVTTTLPTSPVKTAELPMTIPTSPIGEKPEKESCLDNSLPNFKKLKPLKHVAFHSLTFLIDPPQQIPSRNPRKGNVEILPLGAVRVNPLTEADKEQMEKSLRGQGGGLVVGGTGNYSLARKEPKPPKEEEINHQSTETKNSDTSDEAEPAIEAHAKSLGIEKPTQRSSSRQGYTAPVKKMALDLMYSRCCHLREILPIPGIAKQIPQGSMAPLPFLQFRNPTPTMIEIETFADFIRIAPIICISLDGISLSFEQLKILLSAMCAKTQLEKLSLRNTPMDAEGWTLFCWFLSRNKVINKLDITQCPPLSVIKKKKKVKPEEEAIKRMVCNKENRSDMDWLMFTASLIARGGIEELILTGCCITDLKVFETLIKRSISIRTAKLGLAYNQLSPQQFHVVFEHYFLSSKTRGLDLGYNDLLSSAFLKVVIDMYKREDVHDKIANSQLGFLSLNATNLRFNSMFREVHEKFLACLPNLKYLDFSNNPKLFGNYHSASVAPESIEPNSGLASEQSFDESTKTHPSLDHFNSYFCSVLPTFKSLVRLHLDNNGLSSQDLINLFEIVPFCKNLAYLSIIGNRLDIYSATSLIEGLKNASSLMTVDGDYLALPETFREQIGSYSMRNMENYYNKNIRKNASSLESMVGGTPQTLTDQLNKLLSQRNDDKFDVNLPEVQLFIEKTQRYRQKLKESILDLFALQYSSDLNVEGKEALIRLLFVDSSLERGLRLIDESLVDQDDNITTTDILNMNLAEDETNALKNSAHRKAATDNSDQIDTPSRVDTAALPISRSQSSATLSSLNKEEGAVMKLARLADRDTSLEKYDQYSGEEIRQKMLTFDLSDLDNLIETINAARKRGVCFKEVFSDLNFINHFRDDLKQRIENLKRYAATLSKEKGAETFQSQDIDLSRSTESTNIDDSMRSKNMSEAYDRILSKFNK